MKNKNRSALVDDLAAHFAKLTKSDADLAVSTILESMAKALSAGQRIEIRGFGSFSASRRRARIGRNPRSGESVAIPDMRVARFKPGKPLRDAVDKGNEDSKADSPRKATAG